MISNSHRGIQGMGWSFVFLVMVLFVGHLDTMTAESSLSLAEEEHYCHPLLNQTYYNFTVEPAGKGDIFLTIVDTFGSVVTSYTAGECGETFAIYGVLPVHDM